IENLGGWLTTVLSRVCLDALRSRTSRREELVDDHDADLEADVDPEGEAMLVDSVGRALLVVLDRLGPDERVAFVLHDLFAVPFEEVAPIVGRTPSTTKKLASRARQRVQGTSTVPAHDLAGHRAIVEAFLAASRAGDLDAILAVLAPDVVRRADPAALPSGRAREVRGARTVAEEIAVFGANARFAAPALVDGDVGIVVAPRGRLRMALVISIDGDRIAAYELVADPGRLRTLRLAVLDR
ncbi:MAG TPA: sigma factor-like helix-turn-helix DNA-binding protein, partial [Acidimicrobiia bacterium]